VFNILIVIFHNYSNYFLKFSNYKDKDKDRTSLVLCFQ